MKMPKDWRNNLGATGKFPEGKLDDSDEGELQLAVTYDPATDLVRIEFGKPVAWLAMEPLQAVRFANAVIKAAQS